MSFESLMIKAQTMQKLERECADYWIGYQRGLRRAHHGESFGTEAEHEKWFSLAEEENDEGRHQRGIGYRAGLAAMGASALRAIPSEKRSEQSRINGQKGGKPKHLRGGRPRKEKGK